MLEIYMTNYSTDDIKWQDRFTVAVMAVVAVAAILAILGTGKKEVVTNDIEVFDVEDLIIQEHTPLPEITFEAETLPEILPPLFEEPLPPLQGEV